MEPAAERREGLNILGNIQLNDVSQWSLPSDGGSTPPRRRRRPPEDHATVEPYVGPEYSARRRTAGALRVQSAQHQIPVLAAMEPAVDRREYAYWRVV